MTPMRIMIYSRFVDIGRWVDALVRTVTGKYRLRSPEKDLDIQPERPRARISEIESHHVVEPEPASPVDLPEAGDSGLHLHQAPPVPDVVDLELIGDRRAPPDQRPFPPPFLLKLVGTLQNGPPPGRTHTRDPPVHGE